MITEFGLRYGENEVLLFFFSDGEKTTVIRRIAVRETGVSWHHGGEMEAPPGTPPYMGGGGLFRNQQINCYSFQFETNPRSYRTFFWCDLLSFELKSFKVFRCKVLSPCVAGMSSVQLELEIN